MELVKIIKNIKFKKIIGVILVGVLVGNVGFSPELVYETKNTVDTVKDQSSSTSIKSSNPVDLKYLVTKKEDGVNYRVQSYDANDLIGQTIIERFYDDKEQAIFASNLGITDKSKFSEEIETRIQNNLAATDEQRKEIMAYGYNPIGVDGYAQLSNLAGNAQTQVDNLNTLIATPAGDTPENKRKLTNAKKELNEIEKKLNKYPPTVKQQGEILAKLSDDDRDKLLEAINKDECGDSWIPFCETILGSNAEQAIEASFIKNIDPNEADLDKYNQDLANNLVSHTDVGLSCSNMNECKDNLETLRAEYDKEYEACNDNVECENKLDSKDEKLDEAEKLLGTAQGYEKVETGWIYSGIDLIRNQDPQAKASARFFGFGADYSDLPSWLQEEGLVASQICIGHIDGYLDDDSNSGGTSINDDSGMIKYGYNSTTSTVDVIYDLRAYRTRVTPDNMTAITVSVYLKAPRDEMLTYQLGLSYKNGDRIEKHLLMDKTNISAGETVGDMFPFDVEVKGGRSVLENSFFLYLKAKTSSGAVVADASTNIYTIMSGTENNFEVDGVSVSGNNEGNAGDNSNEDSEQATDTFWFD